MHWPSQRRAAAMVDCWKSCITGLAISPRALGDTANRPLTYVGLGLHCIGLSPVPRPMPRSLLDTWSAKYAISVTKRRVSVCLSRRLTAAAAVSESAAAVGRRERTSIDSYPTSCGWCRQCKLWSNCKEEGGPAHSSVLVHRWRWEVQDLGPDLQYLIV